MGIGTKKVFEDDRIVVWHFDLAPGEHGERHTHERDYVVRVIEGSRLEVFGPEDELLETVELEAGSATRFHVEGDRVHSDRPGYPVVPATHSAKNVGTTTFREVLIEFKN